MNKEIKKYLMNLDTLKLEDKYVITISICYKTICYLKRIHYLSKELIFSFKQLHYGEKNIEENLLEIEGLIAKVEKILEKTFELFESDDWEDEDEKKRINEISNLNKEISELTKTNKEMLKGGLVYTKIFNNLGIISSHATSIAKALEFRKD